MASGKAEAQAAVLQSDNPLTRAFWLGAVDPRPLALFRIGVGLSLLHDLIDLTRDFRAFLTDDGILPRAAMHDPFSWGLFDLVGSPSGAAVIYALGCLAVLSFTVGFQTRASTIASWLFLASLHHRNHYMTDGGDDFVRILFFWAIFADLGAAYGVDALRRPVRITKVPAFGLRLLQLQIAVLYFCAARLKFRLGWLHGDNIWYTLQLDGFTRPLGAVLGRYPLLCNLSTKAILAMEFSFAFFAFSPVAIRATRAVAVALALSIQLGILLTMRVGVFTEAMLSVAALFLLPEWIDLVETKIRARRGILPDARPAASIDCPRWRHALNGVVFLQFIFAIWVMFAGRRFPLPRAVSDEVHLLDVEAKYGLFDLVYAIPRWEAPGVLVDGTPVEVLSVVAPGAMSRSAAIHYSRWNKFTFKEREYPYLFPELGAYFCRKYDEETGGPKLASFSLIDRAEPPRPPSGTAGPATERVLWRETCPR